MSAIRRKLIAGVAICAVGLLLVWWITGARPLWHTRTAPHDPVPLRPGSMDPREVIRQIDAQRTEEENWLRNAPTSYLAAVDRKDFGLSGILTVGRAADNDVTLDAGGIEPHHLRVTVDGDSFRVEAVDAAAHFLVKDELKREATLGPSGLGVGRFTLWLSHQRFPALIVFDPESPRLQDFKGRKYFPADLSYRYELPLIPNPDPETVIIMSTRGNRRRAQRAGWFEFTVNATRCRLEATRLLEPGVGEDNLIILFRDTTTGKETYPLGRYVDAKKLGAGRYLLDFNTAYNPACAFSDYYNCPVPPQGNTLPLAIRAGEMDSHYH